MRDAVGRCKTFTYQQILRHLTTKQNPMRKIVVLILIPIITIALIYALVHFIGVQSFSFAWTLNFILMGCVLIFTETLKSPLTSPYYNEKTWERRGKIYESAGINFFRKLLVWTGWEKLNKKSSQ